MRNLPLTYNVYLTFAGLSFASRTQFTARKLLDEVEYFGLEDKFFVLVQAACCLGWQLSLIHI